MHRLLERAADRHGLPDGFHLGGEPRVGAGKFLEREARNFGYHVIDGGLEGGRRGAAGDLVLELIERVADRELRRDFGDRKSGGLRGERRGARHARIHLDDQHPAILGVDGELHVRAARVHADLAQHRDRGIAQALILAVGQGLCGRDRDRIAGVHAHRVDVLDRAHDDAVVVAIPHHLHLVLFPAEHRLLEQHLVGGRGIEAAGHDGLELLAVVGDAAAAAAQGERGPDHRRKADLGLYRERLLHAVGDARAGALEPNVGHGAPEELAVLRHVDGALRGADHLDVVLLENPLAHQIERGVEGGLSAHRRQQRARTFLLDDALDGSPVDGLDVDRIRGLRIGHDRGRIRIHQDDSISLFFQRLTRLSSGIVELASLADDDGSRADDENAVEVGAFRHQLSADFCFAAVRPRERV